MMLTSLIYKNFTNEDDHISLIHFTDKYRVKMELQPVNKRNNVQKNAIEGTYNPIWGGTAFYDALITACAIKVCIRSSPFIRTPGS